MDFGDSDVLKNETPSKDLAWWVPNIDHRITPKIRVILETYSGIPPDEVVAHVYNMWEKAWNIRPWPCTRMGQFLRSSLLQHTYYTSVLSRLRSGEAHFLDLGCYCGTDLRQLMLDGTSQANLHGLDIVNHWDLGYDLYRDNQTFNAEYMEADLLATPSSQMRAALWDWGTQVCAVSNIVALSKVGSLVIGFQVGTRDERVEWDVKIGKDKPAFHSLGTFKRVWEEAGRITRTEWRVEGRLREWRDLRYREEETAYLGEHLQILGFEVKRTG